jgi:hypothetical protein
MAATQALNPTAASTATRCCDPTARPRSSRCGRGRAAAGEFRALFEASGRVAPAEFLRLVALRLIARV